MDRKTFLGVMLISIVLTLVIFLSSNNQKKNAPAKAQYEQSNLQKESAEIQTAPDAAYSATQNDSLSPLFPAMYGTESTTVLDNGLVKIGISSKGAIPGFAVLSGYKN